MKKNTNELIVIDEQVFRDKVLGCWLGKNAGGTLGEPLEEHFGRDEMFDVSWYPYLPEGGIPNDDLEIQLVWLQALQEKGPGIEAADLAQYWLNCIAYNFDEYGLSKTNLQKGLAPPISGWHNNWFKDCMGSPIRSEIWACVAPGAPEIAAWYAFQDAICDHAGGESVYGEVFNAVVESSAFIISDKQKLIELGLKAIPEQSLTYQAIYDTAEFHAKGIDWIEARERVKEKYYHPVAQYSPINMGFQTIGWLYGEDFGDAICKAVNCGWDTDCTAATTGALLGIIHGAERLPRKWLDPLSDEISTNLTTGGIKNLNVPTNIHELTDQVTVMAKQVLQYWNANVKFSDELDQEQTFEEQRYYEILEIQSMPSWLQNHQPNVIDFKLQSVEAAVRYEGSAAITGDESSPSRFALQLRNPHPEPIVVSVRPGIPKGWTIGVGESSADEPMMIEPQASLELDCHVTAPSEAIQERNIIYMEVSVRERSAEMAIPVVYLGASQWLASEIFPDRSLNDDCGIEETVPFDKRPKDWEAYWCTGNDLHVEQWFSGQQGVIYLLHHLYSDNEQNVVVGVPNNNKMKIWHNGEWLHQTDTVMQIRPNQGNGDALGDRSNYANTTLTHGWNQFLIKLERGTEPLEAHFTLGSLHERYPKNHGGAVMNINRSNFLWE